MQILFNCNFLNLLLLYACIQNSNKLYSNNNIKKREELLTINTNNLIYKLFKWFIHSYEYHF